jgi:hypothetical protein
MTHFWFNRTVVKPYNKSIKRDCKMQPLIEPINEFSVRGWALCNKILRTPPGPEGSNGKWASLCAAGSPGPDFFDVNSGKEMR